MPLLEYFPTFGAKFSFLRKKTKKKENEFL